MSRVANAMRGRGGRKERKEGKGWLAGRRKEGCRKKGRVGMIEKRMDRSKTRKGFSGGTETERAPAIYKAGRVCGLDGGCNCCCFVACF